MTGTQRSSCSALLAIVGLFLVWNFSEANDALRDFINRAYEHEKVGDWEKARENYESALQHAKFNVQLRERYLNVLHRCWQGRRHRDFSYRKEVLGIDFDQAVYLYGKIRDTFLKHAVDRRRITPTNLFQKGLEEFDAALADPFFLQQHLPSAKPSDVQAFRTVLHRTWGSMAKMTPQELQRQVSEVALSAQGYLGLDAAIVVMEFACGACYAIDDYTVYLTPNQLRELCDSLRGEAVGVGLTLVQQDGRLVIQEVAPDGPAAAVNPALKPGDQMVSVSKKPVAQLPLDAIRDLLEGPVGSDVEMEIVTPGMEPRSVVLRRRLVLVSSVAYQLRPNDIGYLQITAFQDTTLQEVENALAILAQSGMKGLVLDLRGNPGGLIDVAIEVTGKFLSSGIIATSLHEDPKYKAQNFDSKFDKIYQARNPSALTIPMIVLVDGDTASAAEVMAGALKDNQRARLIGQNTFGKGCTQRVLKLPSAAGNVPTGGLRLTVERFFSPKGEPYSGRGVLPDRLIDRVMQGEMMMMVDRQMDAAVSELEEMLKIARN